MKSLGLSYFTDTHWTLVGLLIFLSLFLFIILFQMRKYDKETTQVFERLPFDGDDK